MLEKLREQAQTSATAAVEEHLSPPDPEPGPVADEEKPPELVHGPVDELVREHLRHVYRRAISEHRVWEARWWEYDEAVIRLEALWRAWEHLQLDTSTGMSVWWRDHADHHMAVLMDPEGPFAADDRYGDENGAGKGAPLPYFEVELHWVQRGGMAPLDMLEADTGACKLVHLKDIRVAPMPEGAVQRFEACDMGVKGSGRRPGARHAQSAAVGSLCWGGVVRGAVARAKGVLAEDCVVCGLVGPPSLQHLAAWERRPRMGRQVNAS